MRLLHLPPHLEGVRKGNRRVHRDGGGEHARGVALARRKEAARAGSTPESRIRAAAESMGAAESAAHLNGYSRLLRTIDWAPSANYASRSTLPGGMARRSWRPPKN